MSVIVRARSHKSHAAKAAGVPATTATGRGLEVCLPSLFLLLLLPLLEKEKQASPFFFPNSRKSHSLAEPNGKSADKESEKCSLQASSPLLYRGKHNRMRMALTANRQVTGTVNSDC